MSATGTAGWGAPGGTLSPTDTGEYKHHHSDPADCHHCPTAGPTLLRDTGRLVAPPPPPPVTTGAGPGRTPPRSPAGRGRGTPPTSAGPTQPPPGATAGASPSVKILTSHPSPLPGSPRLSLTPGESSNTPTTTTTTTTATAMSSRCPSCPGEARGMSPVVRGDRGTTLSPSG